MLRFKPIYRIALKRDYKAGLLTQEDYERGMEPLRWPIRTKRETKEKVNILDCVRDFVYTGMVTDSLDIDWSNILKWIKEHWVQILELIISLLLILEPPDKER